MEKILSHNPATYTPPDTMDIFISDEEHEKQQKAAAKMGRLLNTLDNKLRKCLVGSDTLYDQVKTESADLLSSAISDGHIRYYQSECEVDGSTSVDEVQTEQIDENDEVSVLDIDESIINSIAPDVYALKNVLCHSVMMRYRTTYEDAEDVFAVATTKFLFRVGRGKMHTTFNDERHLKNALKEYLHIEYIEFMRHRTGRTGKKVSRSSTDDQLLEKINSNDENSFLDEHDQIDIDTDFIKNLMPYLTAREQRIIILAKEFQLDGTEIAKILGTTPMTIWVSNNDIKNKAKALKETIVNSFASV